MAFLTDLDVVLRERGVKVKTHAGWKTRGYAGLSFAAVRGVLWHHTATHRSRFANDDAPTLNLCMYGRSDLPGPLCQIVLGRDGTAHVIAAGWGNHAGYGSYPGIPTDQGNAYLIGVEMESSGIPPYDWTPAQLQAIPILRDALRDGYGHNLDIGHMEWSSGGKIDPAGLPGGMNWLRTAKADSKITAAAAASKPVSTNPLEEIMSWYKNKEEFEEAIAFQVQAYKGLNPKPGDKDSWWHQEHTAEQAAYKAIREHMVLTDPLDGKKVDAQVAAYIGTIWKQVHRYAPQHFKNITARLGALEAAIGEVANGGDLAAVTEASKAGARAALEEWERDNAQEIAAAVVDEQAERLAPKEEAK